MKKILIVSAILALVACGGDDGATAVRPHFASDITAAPCANGKLQATATWQVPSGDWVAIFVGLTNSGHDSSARVSGAVPAASQCVFAHGDRVYAILFPFTVQSDADLTKTIVMP